MKKYILTLILTSHASSAIIAMNQKADLQVIATSEKAILPDQIKPSLHEQFSNLPIELRREISQYLTPQAPSVLTRAPGFNNATTTASEIESIKDYLRTLYVMQYNQKSALEISFKKPSINQIAAYNALKYATQNKYGQHTIEITGLAVACGADITRDLASGKSLKKSSTTWLLQQAGSINGYKQHYEKLVHDAVKNDYVPMAKLSIAAGFKDQLIEHVDSRPPAIKIIHYLIDSSN